MTAIKRPVNLHDSYHAHVYFDENSVEFATEFCEQAGDIFNVPVGKVHAKNVGPHPRWSCQISLTNKNFDAVIPWLDENRNGLSILVHANTDNHLKDHTDFAYWLGEPVDLVLSIFER